MDMTNISPAAARPVPMPIMTVDLAPGLPAAVERAAMKADPSVPPPTVAETEQACVEAYALVAAARRQLMQAEAAHAVAIKAARP